MRNGFLLRGVVNWACLPLLLLVLLLLASCGSESDDGDAGAADNANDNANDNDANGEADLEGLPQGAPSWMADWLVEGSDVELQIPLDEELLAKARQAAAPSEARGRQDARRDYARVLSILAQWEELEIRIGIDTHTLGSMLVELHQPFGFDEYGPHYEAFLHETFALIDAEPRFFESLLRGARAPMCTWEDDAQPMDFVRTLLGLTNLEMRRAAAHGNHDRVVALADAALRFTERSAKTATDGVSLLILRLWRSEFEQHVLLLMMNRWFDETRIARLQELFARRDSRLDDPSFAVLAHYRFATEMLGDAFQGHLDEASNVPPELAELFVAEFERINRYFRDSYEAAQLPLEQAATRQAEIESGIAGITDGAHQRARDFVTSMLESFARVLDEYDETASEAAIKQAILDDVEKVITGMFLGMFAQLPHAESLFKAHRSQQMRQVLYALVAYRERHGEFPASLEGLPDEVDTRDRFGDGTLRYVAPTQEDPALRLYSVGENGTDNGGDRDNDYIIWPRRFDMAGDDDSHFYFASDVIESIRYADNGNDAFDAGEIPWTGELAVHIDFPLDVHLIAYVPYTPIAPRIVEMRVSFSERHVEEDHVHPYDALATLPRLARIYPQGALIDWQSVAKLATAPALTVFEFEMPSITRDVEQRILPVLAEFNKLERIIIHRHESDTPDEDRRQQLQENLNALQEIVNGVEFNFPQ